MLDRGLDHLFRLVRATLLERRERRVVHESDAGERLERTVVKDERQPPAFVLLGGDELGREERPLRHALAGLGEQPCLGASTPAAPEHCGGERAQRSSEEQARRAQNPSR